MVLFRENWMSSDLTCKNPMSHFLAPLRQRFLLLSRGRHLRHRWLYVHLLRQVNRVRCLSRWLGHTREYEAVKTWHYARYSTTLARSLKASDPGEFCMGMRICELCNYNFFPVKQPPCADLMAVLCAVSQQTEHLTQQAVMSKTKRGFVLFGGQRRSVPSRVKWIWGHWNVYRVCSPTGMCGIR